MTTEQTKQPFENHGAFADEGFGKHKLHKSFTKQFFKEEIGKLLQQVNEAKKGPKEKFYNASLDI